MKRNWLLLFLCVGVSCGETDANEGSQTHWLEECTTSSDCGDSFSCLCGRCTIACEEGTCDLPGVDASCFGEDSEAVSQLCADSNPTPLCLASCEIDAECASTEQCVRGACAPEDTQPSSGGNGGAGGQGGQGSGNSSNGAASGAGTGGAGGMTSVCDADLTSDDENCGACGYACVGGRTCDGGRCTPAWLEISSADAPSPRTKHQAVFFGDRYVVFGGAATASAESTDTAGAYDPDMDVWEPFPHLKKQRCGHEAAAAGDRIIAFGGHPHCGDSLNMEDGDLEEYTEADGWETIGVTGEPTHRYDFASVWTGQWFMIFGGNGAGSGANALGAIYDPSVPSWTDASCLLQDCERDGTFSMFWDDDVVRGWGGGTPELPASGLTYHPDSEIWSGWGHPAGSQGKISRRFADDGERLFYLKEMDLVTIYDRKLEEWTEDDSYMPVGFCVDAAAAWSGTELIAWSGYCGSASDVGGRYQPPAP
jgi:hypothetical protein